MLLKYLHFFANFKFASSILIHTFLSIIKVFIQKIIFPVAFRPIETAFFELHTAAYQYWLASLLLSSKCLHTYVCMSIM